MIDTTHSPAQTGHPRAGVVFRKSLGTYAVRSGGEDIQCAISSKLRKHLERWWAASASPGLHVRVEQVHDIREVDPVAIGDQVRFVEASAGGNREGMITEVLPRRNRLSRIAAGRKPIEQVLVANVDWVVPVFAVRQPKPKWALLDRNVAAAESFELPVLICITKTDLGGAGHDTSDSISMYRDLGYDVMPTSAVTGEGIDRFEQAIRGRISVLVGKSGVGKTSLLNAIRPGLGLCVSEVSSATG